MNRRTGAVDEPLAFFVLVLSETVLVLVLENTPLTQQLPNMRAERGGGKGNAETRRRKDAEKAVKIEYEYEYRVAEYEYEELQFGVAVRFNPNGVSQQSLGSPPSDTLQKIKERLFTLNRPEGAR